MRRLLCVILFCAVYAASATPTVDPALYEHVPRQAVVELIIAVEQDVKTPIASLTYMPRDDPPVGEQAVVVSFLPADLPGGAREYSSKLFYLRSWRPSRLFAKGAQTRILGRWITDDTRHRVVKQGLTVAGRRLYVTVREPLAASVAERLLESIQTNSLVHGDVLCWSPKATRIVQAVGVSRIPALQSSEIDEVYGDRHESEDVVVVRTRDNAFYSFRHVGEQFSLACMWQAVI